MREQIGTTKAIFSTTFNVTSILQPRSLLEGLRSAAYFQISWAHGFVRRHTTSGR